MFHQFLPGEPSEMLKSAVDYNLPWMLFLGLAILLATCCGHRASIPFKTYFWLRFIGGVVLLLVAALTIYYTIDYTSTLAKEGSRVNRVTLPLGVFWVLFPPMWFFTEYYAFDRGLICPPRGTSKKDHLASMRDYAGFASKVWAAVLALFLFSISQIGS